MLIDALDGRSRFEKIPNNHAIYHSFFDLQGPPFGGDYRPGQISDAPRAPQVDALEGSFSTVVWSPSILIWATANSGSSRMKTSRS